VIFLVDSEKWKVESQDLENSASDIFMETQKIKNKFPEKPLLILANKLDLLTDEEISILNSQISNLLFISAKENIGIDQLQMKLLEFVNTGELRNNNTIVTNSRHYNALLSALEEINQVQEGLNANLSGDLLAIDIRQALYHFGEITGEVTNDELLGNIFANFCIGK